jgi:hypothetical protein
MRNDRGLSIGNGDSAGATPEAVPLWLRGDWQYAQVRASQYSNWTEQA